MNPAHIKSYADTAKTALNLLIEEVKGYVWQPIDYSQAKAGNAPFGGDPILLQIQDPHFSQTSHAVVQSFWRVSCIDAATGWYASFHNTRISNEKATHWMPLPEFLKG